MGEAAGGGSTSERGARLARVLAFEVSRILRQLRERRELLLQLWSRYRAREPMIEALFSRWRTLEMTDLIELDAVVIEAVEPFYEAVDRLRTYFRFTEDMPVTLEEQLEAALVELEELGELALARLGGDPRASGGA
jgi:hypothetical protein